jgi:hypothetical protein
MRPNNQIRLSRVSSSGCLTRTKDRTSGDGIPQKKKEYYWRFNRGILTLAPPVMERTGLGIRDYHCRRAAAADKGLSWVTHTCRSDPLKWQSQCCWTFLFTLLLRSVTYCFPDRRSLVRPVLSPIGHLEALFINFPYEDRYRREMD